MNDKNQLLLPSGLYDLLPPDARKESAAVARLLAVFESFGYAQVSPPLMEFEASLLGDGGSLSPQTFRVMDTMSQNMMGFRSDMTMQVARIARSRMAAAAHPLRLCYAGQILQTQPEALQNERQLTQAGIELIGSDSLQADVEVMMVAAEALNALAVKGISIDINLPGLLARLCPEARNNFELQLSIRNAVSQRDSDSIKRLPLAQAGCIVELIETAGTAEKSLKTLEKLKLPEAVSLRTVFTRLKESCPNTVLTLDPLEFRGFDYHQGISFSIFAKGLRHELGRGGRYEADDETATGFTLYVTHLLDLLPAPVMGKMMLLAQDTSAETARTLRKDGWITIGAMSDNLAEEAKRLNISAIHANDKITKA
jgi:ATP phosphoribosyltransferase regulatory subunit